jgi:hypothetical protein
MCLEVQFPGFRVHEIDAAAVDALELHCDFQQPFQRESKIAG